VGPRSVKRLGRERERLDDRARRLSLVHPRRVIDRGYAILRLGGGGLLTRPQQAPAGSRVLAELRGGRLGLLSEGPAPGDGRE
jgi:exodeoxyribonuclease VII large subunit